MELRKSDFAMKNKIKKISARSLSFTLVIAFFALSLVVLLIAGGLQIYFNFQNQQNFVSAQQQLIAREAAYNVRGFILEKIGTLESAVILGDLVDSQKEEKRFVLEKLIGIEPAFRQLVLFNKQGEEILKESRVSNLVSSQLTEHIGNEAFSQVSQGETYISPVYIEEITSEPQVIMAVPIKNVFGDFRGILIAEVNLKFMWDLVGMLKIGKSGIAYVVDSDGNLIAFGDISRVLRGENLAYLDEVNEFVYGSELNHESVAEISKGILDTDVMTTHENLGTPDWAVVVELPVLEAYETVIQGIGFSVGIIVVNAVLAIMVGFYLSKRISKPIKNLTKNIEDISMGRLDTEVDPKLKDSKDEIGNLARAFDRTLVSLKLSMKQTAPKLREESQELRKILEDKKKLEKQLRESEKRFKDILYSTVDWVWEVDKNGVYTFVSGKVKKILGYEPEELIGKTPLNLMPPDEAKRVGEIFGKIASGKKPIVNLENWNLSKDGRRVLLLTNGVPMLDEGGELVGYRGVDKDITQENRKER